MITAESLLKSKEFWLEHIQNDLYAEVEEYLQVNNLSRKEFAEQLGVTKGYVSQVLNGSFDHKLSKLVELALSINKAAILKFHDLDECIKDYKMGQTHFSIHDRPTITLNLNAQGIAPAMEENKEDNSYIEFKDVNGFKIHAPLDVSEHLFDFLNNNQSKEPRTWYQNQLYLA